MSFHVHTIVSTQFGFNLVIPMAPDLPMKVLKIIISTGHQIVGSMQFIEDEALGTVRYSTHISTMYIFGASTSDLRI